MPVNQGHIRASEHGGSRYSTSHFAAGMIGDKSDRIYAFSGRTCGNEDFFPRQIFLTGYFF